MTTYVNVGVYSDNQRIKTKKALKEMVKNDADNLRFDQTSPLARNELSRLIKLSELVLNPSHVLSVVGPDPYSDRRWYATIEIVAGKIHVN